MFFSSVIGQDSLKSKIFQQIRSGKLSHATLFTGNCGYGGFPMMLALAQYLNCENPTDSDSCGHCPSCLKNQKLVHPDVHFSFPVTTTPTVKKDPLSKKFLTEWREMVLENAYFNMTNWFEKLGVEKKQGIIPADESNEIIKLSSLKSYEGKNKVFIIWLADRMNSQSVNKLLKVIEEPPQNTIFLLTAESTENILPTLLSRVQRYTINPIDDQSMVSILVSHGHSGEKANEITRLSNGSWIEARRIAGIDQSDSFNFENFREWTRMCYKARISEITGWVDKMSPLGREKQKIFFSYSLNILRECMLSNYNASELGKLSGDEDTFKRNFAPFIHHENLEELIEEFSRASYHIERNGNPKVILLDLSLNVIRLLKIKTVTL